MTRYTPNVAWPIALVAVLTVLAGCRTASVETVEGRIEGPLMSVDQCLPLARQQLASLGVAEGEIASLQSFKDEVDVQRNQGEEEILQGVTTWADLTDCEGYLVINHAPDCRVEGVWSRGACTVPGAS